MKYEEIYKKAISPKKRNEDKVNVILANIIRPLSIIVSSPLLKTSITPVAVTKLSVVSLILSFLAFCMNYNILGWLFIFIWSILDCVDGNIARYKNQCSIIGDLWDTFGGYLSMIIIYLSAGIVAYRETSLFGYIHKEVYLILGDLTTVFCLLPRLMMHKKMSTIKDSKVVNELREVSEFSLSRIIAVNIIAPIGLMQIIHLLCIVFKMMNIFILFYCVINFAIMVISICNLLKEEQ